MPIVSYKILIFDAEQYHDIVTTIHDVPFFGHLERGQSAVKTVWDEREFKKVAAETQDWINVVVATDAKEQLNSINEVLNDLVNQDPYQWIYVPPGDKE